MASLIKNQILKHLSKFAKNLSTDKINVSTLKGEGDLTNLELDEDVLTDLLELPLWVRLKKAVCNKVACKIMWTKLKSVPINMYLDEVLVEMETCEELRVQPTSTSMPSYSSGGKYGFSDKVIDGMTVVVNSIVINFKSPAFQASFQLSRLCLDSRTPTWQRSDLRMTRLKEPDRAELLIFKQLEWQTLRIEATAVRLQEQFSTPLRLITNQARCRITIKKRLSDCSILGSRLVLILDDLLWVLTDSQLKAALHFASSLSGLVQQATELAQKTKAARKLESLPGWQVQPTAAAHTPRQPPASRVQVSAITRIFNLHDVVETSYHFCSGQIDLHLCDEVSPDELRSCHPLLADGGAMQISFHNLAIDYYPYHLASGDRKHWLRYKESSTARNLWVTSLLSDFRQRMTELVQGELPRTHIPVHRTSPYPPAGQQDARRTTPSSKNTLGVYLARLMSMCLVLRMEDFAIFRVSTSGTRNGTPQKFVGSDKGRLLLPDDLSAIHVEFTQYYYPEDNDIPVPAPNLFAHMNPIQVTFDPLTILWLNAFVLNLQRSQVLQQPPDPQKPTVDVRIEALMPRAVICSEKPHANQPDWPKQLQIQISRLVITNSRLGDVCGRMELGKCLETFQQGELFFGSSFPSSEQDFNPVVEAFVQHSLSHDRKGANECTDDSAERFARKAKAQQDGVKDLFDKMHKDLLWSELKNIWCVSMDPVWADFAGVETNRQRPVPFLDAFPLVLWVYQNPTATKARTRVERDVYCNGDVFQKKKPTANSSSNSRQNGGSDGENVRPTIANLHILAHIPSLVNVQVDHSQYIFILRAIEAASDLSKQLTLDTSHILSEPVTKVSSSCYAALFPELDVTLLMPTGSSGRTTDNDENDSVKSADSFPADLPDGVSSSRIPLISHTRSMKESPSSDQIGYKSTDTRMEREESLTGSLTKSCSDSLLDSRSLQNGSPPQSSPLVRSQEVLVDTKIMEDDETSLASSLPKFTHGRQGSFSSGEWAHLEKVPDNLTRTLASGSSVVKKSFSSFISSLDSAISSRGNTLHATAEKRGASPDELQVLEDWETMSIRSDMSSDSDQFLMVHMDTQPSRVEDALFSLKDAGPPKVEMANEMKEDTNSNPSSTSLKRPELMSVLTIRLANVQYIQEALGLDSVFRLQSGRIGTEELGSVSWDDFQSKFSAKSRNWREISSDPSLLPCEMKLRMESGPDAERLCPSAGEVGILTAIAKDVFLNLLSSNSSGLGDFFQDDVVQPPMPVRIYLHNFSVHIEENRQAITSNSSETAPLDINVAAMTIRREPDGILRFMAVDPEVNQYITTPFLSSHRLPSEICHLLAKGGTAKSVLPVTTPYLAQCSSGSDHFDSATKTELFGTSSGESVATLEESHSDATYNFISSTSASLDRRPLRHHLHHSSSPVPSGSMESLIEANEQLKLKLLALDSLQAENEELRAQIAFQTSRAEGALKQVDELTEEVHHLQEEKRSLLATRQVLQNELVALESRRSSLVNQTSTG